MPEIAESGKPTVFASSAARHCANSWPGVMPAAKSTSRGGEPSAPLSLLSLAPVGSTASSSALLLGSITAMATTIAATSCIPSGAVWQHSDGGDGVGVGVAFAGGHEQIRVSHGVSVKIAG